MQNFQRLGWHRRFMRITGILGTLKDKGDNTPASALLY